MRKIICLVFILLSCTARNSYHINSYDAQKLKTDYTFKEIMKFLGDNLTNEEKIYIVTRLDELIDDGTFIEMCIDLNSHPKTRHLDDGDVMECVTLFLIQKLVEEIQIIREGG